MKRFMYPDSALVPTDAPCYKTLNAGRLVYGGCGIEPDRRVAYDDAGSMLLYWRLHTAGVFERAAARCYALTQGNFSRLSATDWAERLRHEARRSGIETTADEVLASPLIMKRMEAVVMRQSDCRKSVLEHTMEYDPDMQAALRLLDDGSYERMLK